MKKSLFVLGVAVAALAEEVTEVAQNRAISFNSFVNNSTKTAVTEIVSSPTSNLSKFYAFGVNQADDNTSWTDIYDNTEVTGTAIGTGNVWKPADTRYWAVGKEHRFAAYSNGNASFSGTKYDAATQALKFENYAVSNSSDLIAAIPAAIAGATVTATYNTPVGLSFEHLLAQVKFTFTTTDADVYTLRVYNFAIASAITTATCTYTYNQAGNTIVWADGTSGTYNAFDEIADVAATGTHSTASLVIPQGNSSLKVTFDAELKDESGDIIGVGSFEAPLAYTSTSEGESNKWTAGLVYNYTAEINGSMLHDPDEEDPEQTLQPITFEVDEISTWTPADETELEESDITSTETTEP